MYISLTLPDTEEIKQLEEQAHKLRETISALRQQSAQAYVKKCSKIEALKDVRLSGFTDYRLGSHSIPRCFHGRYSANVAAGQKFTLIESWKEGKTIGTHHILYRSGRFFHVYDDGSSWRML